jgi:YHS domain-containing protein
VFKLFIYALFLYVLYRLLTGGRKKKPVSQGSVRQSATTDDRAVHDQLVEDPVCHIYIPKRQAIVLQDGDTPVFFCSEQCRKMYRDAHETDRQENG